MPHPFLFRKTYFSLNELTPLVNPDQHKVWKQMYSAVLFLCEEQLCRLLSRGWILGVFFRGVEFMVHRCGSPGKAPPSSLFKRTTVRSVDGRQLPAATPWGSATAFMPRLCSHWATPRQWLGKVCRSLVVSAQCWTPLLGRRCPGLTIDLAQILSELHCK